MSALSKIDVAHWAITPTSLEASGIIPQTQAATLPFTAGHVVGWALANLQLVLARLYIAFYVSTGDAIDFTLIGMKRKILPVTDNPIVAEC